MLSGSPLYPTKLATLPSSILPIPLLRLNILKKKGLDDCNNHKCRNYTYSDIEEVIDAIAFSWLAPNSLVRPASHLIPRKRA